MNSKQILTTLSNSELTERLLVLRTKEHSLACEVLLYLAEVEERKLYLEQGYSSMFSFCTSKLQYSESAANRRIRSARAVRAYPEILEQLKENRINLSTLSLVAGIITEDNVGSLVERIRGKSQREVEVIVAGYRPIKSVREEIKPVAIEAKTAATPLLTKTMCNRSGGAIASAKNDGELFFGEVTDSSVLETSYKVTFSVSMETKKKLEQVQLLLSNKHPRGVSMEKAFEELVDEYLGRHSREARMKRRNGTKKRAATEKRKEGTRRPHVPRTLKDEVFARDEGCCSYVSADGRRCGSQWDLEIDHIIPVARDGRTELENLRLLCRGHNRLEAERVFGKKLMSQYASL